MSTLALSRLGGWPALRSAALPVAFVLWALAAAVLWLDVIVWGFPHARLAEAAVVNGIPLGLAILALLRRTSHPESKLPLLAGLMCAAAGAIWAAPQIPARGTTILALPGLLLVALAVRRWPVPALIGTFACSAFYGSAQAFLDLPLGQVADGLLGGLWIGLAFSLFTGRRDFSLGLSPGVVLMSVYVLITLAMVALSPDVDFALRVFRFSTWHLLVFILIPILALRARSLEAVAHGAVAISVLVGAYACVRWAIGAAEQERALLAGEVGVMFNQVAPGEDKVQGSFPNGQELGLWTALMIPFCAAGVLTWRGRFRIVALAATPLLAVGLLGSGQRTGFIAAVCGTLAVIVLNQMARGFRGPRLGIATGAVIGLIAAGVVIFPAVVDTPEKVQRYENILTPSRDGPFQERLYKWESALADADGKPFGRGIGTGGPAAGSQRFPGKASDNVDSSYIQLAYEQGFVVMILFIFALVMLLLELMRHAVWTPSGRQASLTIGAAGTLTALAIALAGNLHLNALAILGGWLVVGLGVAQLLVQRRDEAAAAG